MKSKYLKTGEFCKLARTTKNTLFHYDHINLFSPAYVKNNKYRYYSLYQLEEFDVITLLKDMSVPLGTIKEIMHSRNCTIMKETFTHKKDELEKQIEHLNKQKHWIEMQLDRIEEYSSIPHNHIEIKQKQPFYTLMSHVEETDDEAYFLTLSSLMIEAKKQTSDYFDIIYCQNRKDIETGLYDLYEQTGLLFYDNPAINNTIYHEGGTFLCGYYHGNYQNSRQTYDTMLSYAAKHHLKLDDTFYEIAVIDSVLEKEEEYYINEISIRIIQQ